MTDRAWPNFIAPPLSWPSTENSCSAVRACSSAATASAGRPPTRFPTPRAARPACPRGRPTSLAVRAIEPRGMSVTRPLSPTCTRSPAAPSTGGASRPPRRGRSRSRCRPATVSPAQGGEHRHGGHRGGQHRGAGRHRPGRRRPGWPPRGAGAAQAGGAARQHERADDDALRHRARRAGAGCRAPATVRPPTTACAPRRRRPPRRAAGSHARPSRARRRRPRAAPRAPRPRTAAAGRATSSASGAPAVDDHDTVHRHPLVTVPTPAILPRRRPPAAAVHRAGNGERPRSAVGSGPFDSRLGLRPCRGCG